MISSLVLTQTTRLSSWYAPFRCLCLEGPVGGNLTPPFLKTRLLLRRWRTSGPTGPLGNPHPLFSPGGIKARNVSKALSFVLALLAKLNTVILTLYYLLSPLISKTKSIMDVSRCWGHTRGSCNKFLSWTRLRLKAPTSALGSDGLRRGKCPHVSFCVKSVGEEPMAGSRPSVALMALWPPTSLPFVILRLTSTLTFSPLSQSMLLLRTRFWVTYPPNFRARQVSLAMGCSLSMRSFGLLSHQGPMAYRQNFTVPSGTF